MKTCSGRARWSIGSFLVALPVGASTGSARPGGSLPFHKPSLHLFASLQRLSSKFSSDPAHDLLDNDAQFVNNGHRQLRVSPSARPRNLDGSSAKKQSECVVRPASPSNDDSDTEQTVLSYYYAIGAKENFTSVAGTRTIDVYLNREGISKGVRWCDDNTMEGRKEVIDSSSNHRNEGSRKLNVLMVGGPRSVVVNGTYESEAAANDHPRESKVSHCDPFALSALSERSSSSHAIIKCY
jgi:hypothetical protein